MAESSILNHAARILKLVQAGKPADQALRESLTQNRHFTAPAQFAASSAWAKNNHACLSLRFALRLKVFALLISLSCLAFAADKPAKPAPSYSRPEDIPTEYFFRGPALRSPALNPSGTQVGMVVHESQKDAHGLVIYSIADGKASGIRGGSEFDVRSFSWAGDDRVVFSVTRDNLYAWGLYAMDAGDSRKIVTLNRNDAVEVLGSPKARPNNLLVWIARSARNAGRPGGLVELDLRRNNTSRFGDSQNNVRDSIPLPPRSDGVMRWLRDRAGEVRFAITHDDAKLQLFRRKDADWEQIKIDFDRDSPLAVDHEPSVVFVAHLNEQGQRELRRLDARDGSLGPVLHTDDKYDFGNGSILYSGAEDDVIGLVYARQATEQIWLSNEAAALQAAIDQALPANRLNFITSRSRDGKRLLVVSSSDRHPGSLYFFDRETSKLRRLTEIAPWLPENLMAPVMLTTFKARDGLQLDGYVTVPLNQDPAQPAPMIVLPHGGPWVRDTWGYDAQSQFFASRGYVVFRPNYRGSAGYNQQISRIPRMEFRKMHDDVTDGVRALIAAKIADPARIAIFGSSFGGYLAMAGAAFEPDLYQCAVTFAGVFDWERVMRDDRANANDYRFAWLRRELGDPKQHREKFEAMSPYQHVDKIRIPVFVAHGTEDRNADTGQSRRLVKALAKAGVAHETMFVSDEAHGLAELKHRVEFFTRLEAFLKKHL